MSNRGWIGVDLDGTLAQYDGWKGPTHIGEPVEAMWRRVRQWLNEGKDVRIFTARACRGGEEGVQVRAAIDAWCLQQFGTELPITNVKDFSMIELWDDRAVQVEPNTGRRVDGQP